MQRHLCTCMTIFFILSVIIPFQAFADDPKAREIMQKVDDREDGDNRTSDMLMVLIDKNNDERKKYFKIFSKDKGKDTQTIMFIVDPPSVKDTGFLSFGYDDPGKDDEQFLYLPSLGTAKRIASSDKNGSFMGSDLNYSDMSARELDDFDFKLLKEITLQGVKCWLIEALPRSQDVVEETGYKKSIIAVRQDNYVISRVKAWTSDGKYTKLIDFDNIQLIDQVWVPLTIKVVKQFGNTVEHRTLITVSNVKFNQNLSDDMFTLRRLKKGM